ncbi:hypothetical protein GCM10023147_28240 [Tsukamurella soli]|uniref:Thiosulfate sulfurtransferase n=1 Tax=Tsukamurella soli TaxID=644556 RepID=A0ABP8JRZ6_9ACTN
MAVFTRAQLPHLASEGTTVSVCGFTVASVPEAAYYGNHVPGAVFMPVSGEWHKTAGDLS